MNKHFINGCAILFLAGLSGAASANADAGLCAGYFEKQIVRNHFFGYGGNPASPPPIPSHDLRLVETKVVSSLSHKQAVGAVANPERFADVWETINAWGAEKNVNVVVTIDGWHAFSFPSKAPAAHQDSNGRYAVSADNGAGVRALIDPELLSYIYAIRLPAANGRALRNVSFYDKKGDLVFALHASEAGKEEDPELIAAFDRTWSVIEAMPAACSE